ncbi:MAG: STY4528 family pathogenicity island replication protein [Pseudoalteromonas distincta]
MAMHHTAPCRGPVAIADLFNNALEKLIPDHSTPASGDGFLFSGNRHESVPRPLFLDRRLTPLERNAWQVFRLMLNDDGVTAFPTYEQLRPWLASMPCTARASHETVARALTLLRLTRWLSLVRRRRDPNTGRILGNLYVLHDEPLTPFEAMQLDADYLELVSQSIGHSAKAVQIVGLNTLQEIAEDPLLSGRTLPSRLQVIAERLAREDIGTHERYPQDGATHDSEEGGTSLLRNREHPSTDSEAGPKPAPDNALRNPKDDSTVRSINKVRTTARATQDVRLPDRFIGLKEEQQSGAMVALQQVEASLRQAVLDEWEERCRGSNIRNPAGYLFGIIQRAIRGEFNAWARGKVTHESDRAAVQYSAPPERQAEKMAPGLAKQYLDQMRDLLKEG